MSGKLLILKKAIKGTKTTRKMTKAMELVASSKMKMFQNKASHSIQYSKETANVLSLGLSEDYYDESIFLKENDNKKNLIVLYSSDKGLCGSMNTRIFKTLQKSEIFNENNVYIVIGRKGRKFAKNNNLNVLEYFSDLSDSTSEIEIIEIVDAVIKAFKEEKIGYVYMVTPNYKSTLVFYPKVSGFLPLKKTDLEEYAESNNISTMYKFEPSREAVFEKALENYIVSKFYAAFLDLKAVEYSTRMLAMKNATSAADDRIDSLTLEYNKARQASITQEITEIVNGSVERS